MLNQIEETISAFPIQKIKETPLGLLIDDSITHEEWAEAGRVLNRRRQDVMWAIGDWYNYAHARKDRETDPEQRRVWAQAVAELKNMSQYSDGLIRDAGWVSGSIEMSRRHDTLPWTFHREVAALPAKEQDKWLAKVKDEDMTRATLRAAIRQSTAPQDGTTRQRMASASPTAKLREVLKFLKEQSEEAWEDDEFRAMWINELDPLVEFHGKISGM